MADETIFTTREEAVTAFYEFQALCNPINSATNWGKKGDVDLYESMHAMSQLLQESILSQFGKWNPRFPTCERCRWSSVFGGPSHEASIGCRSGRRPHCSCDTCF